MAVLRDLILTRALINRAVLLWRIRPRSEIVLVRSWELSRLLRLRVLRPLHCVGVLGSVGSCRGSLLFRRAVLSPSSRLLHLPRRLLDRKSTRLNSGHITISY